MSLWWAANTAAVVRRAEKLQAGCSDLSGRPGVSRRSWCCGSKRKQQCSQSIILDASPGGLNLLHFLRPGNSVLEETWPCLRKAVEESLEERSESECSLQTHQGRGSRSSYKKAQYCHNSKWDLLPRKLLRLEVVTGCKPLSYHLPTAAGVSLVERGHPLEGAVRYFTLPKLSLPVS